MWTAQRVCVCVSFILFCWVTFGSGIHTFDTVNIVVDQAHPITAAVLPGGSGFFQLPATVQKHDEESQVSPWPPNHQDFNQIEHL